jgi:hypothetical protein
MGWNGSTGRGRKEDRMDIDIKVPEVLDWFSRLLKADVRPEGDGYVFEFGEVAPDRTYRLPASTLRARDIQEVVDRLRLRQVSEETLLHEDGFYEIIARDQIRMFIPSRLEREMTQYDKDNGITYELSPPSDEYLLFLLKKISGIVHPAAVFRLLYFASWLEKSLVKREKSYSVFDFVKLLCVRHPTIKIRTASPKSLKDVKKYITGFIFNLSYNLGYTVVPQRSIDGIARTYATEKSSRATLKNLDVPRRTYIPDLVYHYQVAISTESPLLQFLSYFHVLEYFFKPIAMDELVTGVRNRLTSPDFSYKRNKDIEQLIRSIVRSVQSRGEDAASGELEALRLTVKRYIDLAELKRLIADFDRDLLAYYRTMEVDFSGGDRIDFDSNDGDAVVAAISSRIYKTRNSIVHVKEGEKKRYIPFHDEPALLKEIPLLRLIAEAVIIRSSETIS